MDSGKKGKITASVKRGKGKSSLRMWILLGIFLILAAMLVYNHNHQAKQRTESKGKDDPVDY
jgi:hypothetical protein